MRSFSLKARIELNGGNLFAPKTGINLHSLRRSS
jgi:hypothetical protein